LTLPSVTEGNKLERGILNGWAFGGIFNARTGNPFNPVLSGDHSGTDERPQRPPLAAGLTHYVPLPSNRHRVDKVAEWFNVQAFNPTPTYGYTNPTSRNSLYGPAFLETDFNLRRQISLGDSKRVLEFRADAYNVFNTPNLANPIISLATNAASAANLNAGQIIATLGKNGSLGSNGRHLQLAFILRY
jgi:hypothetical protein